MRLTSSIAGALLAAAPLFCQSPSAAEPRIEKGALVWFDLTETRERVGRAVGRPAMAGEFGGDFETWQYRIGEIDHDEFSHQFVFRKSESALISVTRSYDTEQDVDALFPEAETEVHYYPGPAVPRYGLRLRRLSGGRLLMAMGSTKPGEPTMQLVLMREAELRYFYPWLAEQLHGKPAAR